MTEQYKRSVCHMCPTKPDCDGLRWSTVCGTCPDSLKCAAREGIGNVDCKKLRAAWLGLPSNCWLVAHLTNQKANHNKYPFTERDTKIVCPRCQQADAQVYIDHGLNHLFKRQTKYIFTCNYCGVDETLKVT